MKKFYFAKPITHNENVSIRTSLFVILYYSYFGVWGPLSPGPEPGPWILYVSLTSGFSRFLLLNKLCMQLEYLQKKTPQPRCLLLYDVMSYEVVLSVTQLTFHSKRIHVDDSKPHRIMWCLFSFFGWKKNFLFSDIIDSFVVMRLCSGVSRIFFGGKRGEILCGGKLT